MASKLKGIFKIIGEHKLEFILYTVFSVAAVLIIPWAMDKPSLAPHLAIVAAMIFVALIIRFSHFS